MKCQYCDMEISDKAKVCPYCRKSTDNNSMTGAFIFVIVLFVAVVFIAIWANSL